MVNKLKWGIQKKYFTTQKYISKFLLKLYNTTDFYLRELDYHFIIKFEKFLRSYVPKDHQRRMGDNTVMKHIERLRKLINLSFRLGWLERDPFINFKAKLIKTERGFLSFDGLKKIEVNKFNIARLELVRNLFIFKLKVKTLQFDCSYFSFYKCFSFVVVCQTTERIHTA